METYQTYRGYGISYRTLGGITEVDKNGIILQKFPGLGEMKGLQAAKNFIDEKF